MFLPHTGVDSRLFFYKKAVFSARLSTWTPFGDHWNMVFGQKVAKRTLMMAV